MAETLTIPGYRIEGRLGQGGMATVYLAIQQSFERKVALKVMSPLLNSDPSFAERFKREARIVAQLNHASIVPVFDVGEHQSHHYLSMEYLPGGDLKRRILHGERDLSLALKVCMALSAALEIAHRKRFVHRDIKPENILFREDGTPVLTDFGIARALDSGRSMTLAGMLVGTPDYMSPEQVKGLELDGRSDLYSVGIVFYEILTGRVPFKAESTLSIALKQVSDPLPLLPPEYAEYQEFLDCLTAKDVEQRFASGAEVVRTLRLINSGKSTRDRTPTPTQGLKSPATEGTPLPRNPTPPVRAQTYASEPTLYRPRVDSSPSAPDPEHVERESRVISNQSPAAEAGSTAMAQHEAAVPAADSRHDAAGQDSAANGMLEDMSGPQQTVIRDAHSSTGSLQSSVVESGNSRRGSDNPQAQIQSVAFTPAPLTPSAQPGPESLGTPSVSANSLPSDSGTHSPHNLPLWLAAAGRAVGSLWTRAHNLHSHTLWPAARRAADSLWASAQDVRNRPRWLAAAGVAALTLCVSLIFIARPHKEVRTAAVTQPQPNSRPAAVIAPVVNPQALTPPVTPTAQPIAGPAPQEAPGPQEAPAEQIQADQTSNAAPDVEPDQSESAKEAYSMNAEARAAARAEEKARRNRKWQEYLAHKAERKAEKERLAAEARTAELAVQETQIQGLLSAAKTQYAAGALWQPSGSSVADSYRAILKIQAQRAEALAGAERLGNVLADEAENAQTSGSLDSSRQLIDQLQSLQATHPKLPALQARLQQMQSSPVVLDARDRGRLEKAAKNIARAVEDLGHKPLDFKAVDDATDQYDRALSVAPKAPGLPSLKERLIMSAYPTVVQTEVDLHDAKRALKLIGNAHKHNWSSPELDQLEASLQGGSAPTAGIKEAGSH